MRLKRAALLLVAGLVVLFACLYFGRDIPGDVWWKPILLDLVLLPNVWFAFNFAFALLGTGKSEATALANGSKSMRLKFGARLVLYFCGIVFGLSVWAFASAPAAGTSTALAVIIAALSALALYFPAVALRGKVVWSDTGITATTWLLTNKDHLWRDLEHIQKKPASQKEVQVIFRGTGKASISTLYEGYEDLIAFAESKLNHA